MSLPTPGARRGFPFRVPSRDGRRHVSRRCLLAAGPHGAEARAILQPDLKRGAGSHARSVSLALVIFFYEILFTIVAVAAVVIGEVWSRLASLVFLLVWLAVVWLGYASFGARLATIDAESASEDDVRWFRDARDGLRHLRLLFGIAVVGAGLWLLVPR